MVYLHRKIKKLYHPEIFQGDKKKKHYFEGWYYKSILSSFKKSVVIIPGIALGKDTNSGHAFIQVMTSPEGKVFYIPFSLDDFSFSRSELDVHIGKNHFTRHDLQVDIEESDLVLKGHLRFSRTMALKSRLLSPGIMGWYSFMPFMECYHGLVSMGHEVSGTLSLNGESLNFDAGKGYIEKDWGKSMPSSWIWMQSNCFTDPGMSFMLSVARIPWLRNSFTGFIGALMIERNIHVFATYTGARVRDFSFEEGKVSCTIEDNAFLIEVEGIHGGIKKGFLQAPLFGEMERRIGETVDGNIILRIKEKKTGRVIEDTGAAAGIELVGTMTELARERKNFWRSGKSKMMS